MPLDIIKSSKEVRPDTLRRHHGVRVNWSSIFSGALVSLAFSMLFLLLGNAIGLSVSNLVSSTASSGLIAGTFIYTAAVLAGSFFIGGMATSLAGELPMSSTGMLHALVAWSLAVTAVAMFGFVYSIAFRAILGGIAPTGLNWLVAVIAIASCAAAILGGSMGSSRTRYRLSRLEPELETTTREKAA